MPPVLSDSQTNDSYELVFSQAVNQSERLLNKQLTHPLNASHNFQLYMTQTKKQYVIGVFKVCKICVKTYCCS